MLKVLAVMTGCSQAEFHRHSLFEVRLPFTGFFRPQGARAANPPASPLIGLLLSLFEGTRQTNEWRQFIFTGFSGGFTTFSTLVRETTRLFRLGDGRTALPLLGLGKAPGGDYVDEHYPLAA